MAAFGPDAAHVAEAFHKELTEQLHVLYSPFKILGIAWNELNKVNLAKLNGTSGIGGEYNPDKGLSLVYIYVNT